VGWSEKRVASTSEWKQFFGFKKEESWWERVEVNEKEVLKGLLSARAKR